MSAAGEPQVSVVLAVRNAASSLRAALDSVLRQDGVRFECIVIDDGSDDDTPQVLAELAATDARMRVLRRAPAGLTRALIIGCELARAPYIARLDADDLMLPDRLAIQHAMLSAQPDLAVLASAFRLCGPRGEHLEDVHLARETTDLTEDMRRTESPCLQGVAHPTVTFRSAHYRRVGGYRPQFALAQDVDLWSRMASLGRIVRDGRLLTEKRVGLDSLSPRHHRLQQRLRRLAERAARARLSGEDEAPWLAEAERLCARRPADDGARASWRAAYFVAACLDRRGDTSGARAYYREAAARSALAVRPRLRLAMLSMRGA